MEPHICKRRLQNDTLEKNEYQLSLIKVYKSAAVGLLSTSDLKRPVMLLMLANDVSLCASSLGVSMAGSCCPLLCTIDCD